MTLSKHTCTFQKKTVIEVNTYTDDKGPVINFLFDCTNKTKSNHTIRFYLKNDILTKYAESYASYLDAQKQPNNGNETPNNQIESQPFTSANETNMVIDSNVSNTQDVTDLNKKINMLIDQVNNLTTLLTRHQEENACLKMELEILKGERTPKRRRSTLGEPNAKSAKYNTNPESSSDDETKEQKEADTAILKPMPKSPASAATKTPTSNQTRIMQTHQNASTSMGSQAAKQTTDKEKKIPPIVVFDNDQKRMSERIASRQICKQGEFYFVRVNKSKYRIHVNTLLQYDKVLELLSEFQIKYHTYTPSERKEIHVLYKYMYCINTTMKPISWNA